MGLSPVLLRHLAHIDTLQPVFHPKDNKRYAFFIVAQIIKDWISTPMTRTIDIFAEECLGKHNRLPDE
jgi:hypothetical protein